MTDIIDLNQTYTDENGRMFRYTQFYSVKNGKTYTCYKKYYIQQIGVGRPRKTQKEKLEAKLNRLKKQEKIINTQLAGLIVSAQP